MRTIPFISAIVAATFATGSAVAQDSKKQDSKQSQAQQSSKQSDDGKSQRRQDRKAAAPQGTDVPVVVLVPMKVMVKPNFADGCWARLYDDREFKGNQLSLVGPVDMPNMRTAFGTDWSGNFESIEVGPRATVTVYDNENYAQKAATFKPNQKVRDLDEKLGFFEQIRSVKISCSGSGGSAKSADSRGTKGSAETGKGAGEKK